MISTCSAADAIELTDFGAAINLYAVYGEIQDVLIVAGSGSITGKTKDSGDTARTFTVAAGEKLGVQLRTIDSVVGVTRVRVYLPDWSGSMEDLLDFPAPGLHPGILSLMCAQLAIWSLEHSAPETRTCTAEALRLAHQPSGAPVDLLLWCWCTHVGRC